ncbi:hypothetical protein CHGG_00584 [Chaetomium globosum CBS 148.51]|uniref:DNA replication factor Cdt1 C-terminal domain-containing protein n=1 Tax=Chaetomium globosum (strain ATCC 6205 / CBS 148.51 / DSM 1962 / NBRC 6347 / NRRL 1970) TaxID=306901 RepID=Q2HGS0_CHAGB|nr:uncharacterized protein CHGG_00584 [Chaetomium globosum CBS 148.51]EAQ92349.1 hypothetical protein CHGG_00584 [Chaetomium globosum CBS 148.51]
MPGVLTRKTRTPRGKLASTTSTATATKFTKVSKQQESGKEARTTTPFTTRSANIEIVLTSRKRKDHDDVESTSKKARRVFESESRIPESSIAPATPISKKRKSVRFSEPEAVPSTPSRAAPTPSSNRKRQRESDETSQAEELLERLNIQSSPVVKRSKTTVHRRAPRNDFDLPKELLDLLDLHSAFLKTLSLQPDSTSASPIDLNTLYTDVTRAWGKRHVGLVDIQRCVGVLAWTPVKSDSAAPRAPYFLTDYGRDKICIEFYPGAERNPLHQHKLKMDFEANLRTLWLSRRDDIPATIFIGTLPKAALKPCALSILAPKTQTTLDAFKQSITEQKQKDQAAKAALLSQTTPPGGAGGQAPKLSLLDRIRLKETLMAQSPSTELSAAEVQRRSALQRAADVAAVVGMLCKATVAAGSGQVRVSFTMAALMGRLKDSMRTPVSQEDGMVCVRLLATEVAPQWLRVVKIGGRENVICMMGLQPTKAEVEERVKVLLGLGFIY